MVIFHLASSITDIILGTFTNVVCESIWPLHIVQSCGEHLTLISEQISSVMLHTCLSICSKVQMSSCEMVCLGMLYSRHVVHISTSHV